MHVDTVSPEKLGAGQDQEWGSTGNKMATQLQKARETGEYPGKTDPTQNGKLVATNVRDNGDVQIAGNGVRQKPEAPTSGITSLLQKAVQLKDAVTQKAVEKKDALVATVKEKAPAVAAGIEKFNSLPGWMKELAKKMFSEGGNGTAPKGNDGNRESEKNGNNQNASSTLGN